VVNLNQRRTSLWLTCYETSVNQYELIEKRWGGNSCLKSEILCLIKRYVRLMWFQFVCRMAVIKFLNCPCLKTLQRILLLIPLRGTLNCLYLYIPYILLNYLNDMSSLFKVKRCGKLRNLSQSVWKYKGTNTGWLVTVRKQFVFLHHKSTL